MAFKTEYLYGGLSVAIAAVGLWYTLRRGSSNGGTVVIPALQQPTTAVPATTAASLPTYTAPANVYQLASAQPQEIPYQTRNFGPRHVHRKAVGQATTGPWQPNSATPNTKRRRDLAGDTDCGCSEQCKSSFVTAKGVTIPPDTLASMVQNMNTVATTPQPSFGNTYNDALYNGELLSGQGISQQLPGSDGIVQSSIVQYNGQVSGQVQVASETNATNIRPVANVPTYSGMVQ